MILIRRVAIVLGATLGFNVLGLVNISLRQLYLLILVWLVLTCSVLPVVLHPRERRPYQAGHPQRGKRRDGP